MNRYKAIMLQGTGSSVGKSIIATALCRIFLQDGYTVCPFKAQNMSLNSFVTESGGEMGRAQVVQAQACGVKPSVDMNPVLIKPVEDAKAQIIIHGKPIKDMQVTEYERYKKIAFKAVKASFNKLIATYELVVIEGAGSPAEVNLKARDIANMKTAKLAGAPVILVADIDRGGAFASIVGTMALLEPQERKRIKGFIINKFRGDKSLLKEGLDFIEKKTKKKVIGVIPYFKDIIIPEEDGVALDDKPAASPRKGNTKINIAVIRLPHISNFTDFDPLNREPDVKIRYVNQDDDIGNADAVIIPGTKNTVKDLEWLRKSGLAQQILAVPDQERLPVLFGICGGYQMLGIIIRDPKHIESQRDRIRGLGLLPVITTFGKQKYLYQVEGKEIETGIGVYGYEIHHGKTENAAHALPAFTIKRKHEAGNKQTKSIYYPDGARTRDNRITGTYLHGIFDSDFYRRAFLNRILRLKGFNPVKKYNKFDQNKEFDKLAGLVRANIDMKFIYNLLKSYK